MERHVDEVMAEHPVEEEKAAKEDGGGRGGGSGKVSRRTRTRGCRERAGDSSRATSSAVVDDARGVVLDVSVTEGTVNEREVLESQVEAVREIRRW